MSAKLAAQLNERWKALLDEAQARHATIAATLDDARRRLVMGQRQDRDRLARSHEERRAAEHAARVRRLPTGLKGLWSRITGALGKIKAINVEEARLADGRDREEWQALAARQMRERGRLQDDIHKSRAKEAAELRRRHREVARSMLGMAPEEKPPPAIANRRHQRRITP